MSNYLPIEYFPEVSCVLQEGGTRATLTSIDIVLHNSALISSTAPAFRIMDEYGKKYNIDKKIYFVLANQSNRKALCIKVDDFYVICIDYSVVNIAIKMATIVVFSSDFVDVIKIKNHTAIIESGGGVRPLQDWIEKNDLSKVDSGVVAIVNIVASQAITYIAMHEYSHIINGHLDFIDKYHAVYRGADEYEIVKRTLEFDADACAMNLTMNAILENLCENLPAIPVDTLKLVSTGALLASKILEIYAFNVNEKIGEYLPSGMRTFNSVHICQMCLDRVVNNIDTSTEIATWCQFAIEGAMRACLGSKSKFVDVAKYRADELKMANLDMLLVWAKIKAKLEENKIGDHRLAASQVDAC